MSALLLQKPKVSYRWSIVMHEKYGILATVSRRKNLPKAFRPSKTTSRR
jgi:hypothetical protein